MRPIISYFVALFLLCWAPIAQGKTSEGYSLDRHDLFLENKGQIKNQFNTYRSDIDFVTVSNGVTLFISKGTIHYQFASLSLSPSGPTEPNDPFARLNHPKATISTHRVDVELIGANRNMTVVTDEMNAYYETYIVNEQSVRASTYRKITYKNVYDDIDWVFYIAPNGLCKHEFRVGPYGDASRIRLAYKGQQAIQINPNGDLVIKTNMGEVEELAPVCFSPSGKTVASKYSLTDNVLSYDLGTTSNLIIDPALHWGTYYGRDSSSTQIQSVTLNANKAVLIVGQTYSALAGTIATSGAFDVTIGGQLDAFLGQFDSLGNRIWASYFGGDSDETGVDIAADRLGNIFITGVSASTNAISTSGTEQPTYGGGYNGYIAKFSASGYRIWGTYFGARGKCILSSADVDNAMNVYVSGLTNDTGLSTASGYQPRKLGIDLFLMKYDSSGRRVWGTYYGGSGSEAGGASCVGANAVFLTGASFSSGLSSPRSYQAAPYGAQDAFLVKFELNGTRRWATYFGGENQETVGTIVSHKNYVYLQGGTQSSNHIATSGAYQSTRGGLLDAFLAKYEIDSGYLQWATYFGGTADEQQDWAFINYDDTDNVYITGTTASRSRIANSRGWQQTFGGGNTDMYVACFNDGGALRWSSYYGGTGDDDGYGCVLDGNLGSLYVVGQTGSPNNIATTGSFLDHGGGLFYNRQGVLAQFRINDTALHTVSVPNTATPEQSFAIFPNPTEGTFTLYGAVAAGTQDVDIRIYDLRGVEVLNQHCEATNGIVHQQFELGRSLPAGQYLLKVISSTQLYTRKLIKR